MKSKFIAMAAVSLLLVGCDRQEPAKAEESKPMPAEKPKPTLAEWTKAAGSAYSTKSLTDAGDGVKEFMACFSAGADGKCSLQMVGKRDGFRKLTHFTPPKTQWNSGGDDAFIGTYIALPDCQKPLIFVTAGFRSRAGWLFMNKASVMADSTVVIEQALEKVSRDQPGPPGWISESASWIATDQQVEALRKLTGAGTILARITGDKGYLSVKREKVEDLRNDAGLVTAAVDAISKALEPVAGADCSR